MKAETRHRMTRRLADWDYTRRAIYMITITLEDRSREWLGHLVNLADSLAKNGEAQEGRPAPGGSAPGEAEGRPAPGGSAPGEAEGPPATGGSVPGHSCPGLRPGSWAIAPTPFGDAVLEALHEMPRLYPQVELLAEQLMPEHLHFVVFVREPLPRPFGQLVRGLKAGAAKRWRALADNLAKNGEAQDGRPAPGGSVPGEAEGPLAPGEAQNGRPAPGGSVPGHSCPGSCPRPGFPPGLKWADGFQDTVLLHDGQLQAMIAYLRDNPRRLAEKRANPALFRRVARLERLFDGGRIIGAFEALGNRHLLERPLWQVQCSRRFLAYRRVPKPGGGLKIARTPDGEPVVEHETPEYRERLESALAAAAHGAVVLSPCISDGERQIARETLKRGLPLVALRNMGFAKCEKPSGGYFEACAKGQLLLMAPAAWPYQTQAKDMTRFDATALNRIAQWLAQGSAPGEAEGALAKNGEAQDGGPAPGCSVPGHSRPGFRPGSCPGFPAEINYHGMQPANIDELAEKAVLARRWEAP